LKSFVDLGNSFAHASTITASINDVIAYYNARVWVLRKLNLQQTGKGIRIVGAKGS